jgi:NHLM bacteriocin system ABC transporter peptidase/ATP-binding protein
LVLVGLLLVIPGLATPVFTRVFVDEILVGRNDDWLLPLLLGMGFSALLFGALTWLQREYLLRLSLKLSITLSANFLWHVLRLPVTFFSARFPGEVASRVHYNDRIASVLSSDLTAHVINGFRVVFFGALMLYYDTVLAGIAFAACVLNALTLRAAARRQTDLAHEVLQQRGKMMGMSMGGLQLIETLKAGGTEGDFFARWAGYFAKLVNLEQRAAVFSHTLLAIPPLLSALFGVLVLAVGALRVMDGHISLGMLVALQSLMASLMVPIHGLLEGAQQWLRLKADLARVDDVMQHPQAGGHENDDTEHVVNERLLGAVELRGITFGYSKRAEPTVKDVSFSIAPGGRAALVGGSGSGKSTLGRVLCGLYEPWAGQVYLDGKERALHAKSTLSSSIAWVDQEVFLFEGSVRDNLSLWNPLVSEADLVRAAKDACIHDDIVRLRGGYDALVAEGGRNFSGGQRQRLEIARALVGNPSVLVLDEATSALDPETEKKVDDNLRRRGCALVIIAHRLSTIRDSDEIIVLERGQVVERGTHESLLSEQGVYARLIASA